MKVAILWKQLSGYTSACFRALTAAGADVLLVYRSATPSAPFSDADLIGDLPAHGWDHTPAQESLREQIDLFRPDVLLVCSWDVGAYRRLSREMSGRTLRILCMDNQWLGTLRQRAGVLAAPFIIRPAYDAVFVPAEPQAAFARRLGFDEARMLWGLYSCDHGAFSTIGSSGQKRPRAFVFAGRITDIKGADTLAEAYLHYRELVTDPWPLIVCGTGPLAGLLSEVPGVEMRGFLQPSTLTTTFAEASCLVLPSAFEPWGVVIHEATAAGMMVICTSACGASTRLALDGYNGFVIPPGNAAALARALVGASTASDKSLEAMGQRSRELSRQFTPERWASYLIRRGGELSA